MMFLVLIIDKFLTVLVLHRIDYFLVNVHDDIMLYTCITKLTLDP